MANWRPKRLTLSRLYISNQGAGIDWAGATSNSANTSPLRVNSNHTGSTTISGGAYLNDITVNSDQVALTSTQAVNGLALNHNFGGGSSSGSRQGLQLYLVQVGATQSVANGRDPYFVGGVFYSIARYTEGGSAATYAGGKGHVFGLNPVARLNNTATKFYEVTGMEVNVTAASGTTAGAKKGIQIVKEASDAVQGGEGIDAGLMIADQIGATAYWNRGIQLGSEAGQWPFKSDGTLIAAPEGQNSRTVAANTGYGVDFSRVKFATAAYKSMGYTVTGAGALTAAGGINASTAALTGTSTGAKLDVPNKLASAAVVSAGGSGYQVGDRITTATGGIYEVATLSGSAVATVTALVWDVSAGATPGNPVSTTTTATSAFFTGGSGCTLNLTWGSANDLELNPSGNVSASGGNVSVTTAGKGLRVKEGSNAKQGVATLVAGSVVVSNTSVTANSRILLTGQADGGTPGWPRVSARTPGTSFTITSSSGTDTSTVAYEIFEPA